MLSSAEHLIFDIAAWLAALGLAVALLLRQKRRFPSLPNARAGRGWFLALAAGAAAGSYGFGTANLWLSGQEGLSRSILGAIVGAILAVEFYKRAVGLTGSTGGVLAAPLALGIAVGRIGCHLAGLDDFTYGVPTGAAWGADMGDGIPRWPVALIEAGIMAATAAGLLLWLRLRPELMLARGFAVFCLIYGLERFMLEFLKPYAPVAGPFNLFHLLCAALAAYAAVQLLRPARREAALA
jgi:prolipoprotein diacylglyceryltransferase